MGDVVFRAVEIAYVALCFAAGFSFHQRDRAYRLYYTAAAVAVFGAGNRFMDGETSRAISWASAALLILVVVRLWRKVEQRHRGGHIRGKDRAP